MSTPSKSVLEDRTPSNAEVAAELQAIALAIRLFGLDALPHVIVKRTALQHREAA